MTKTLIPAAGYLRMSSDKQETSLTDQRDEVLGYAAKHGYKIVKWYTDEGISGWKGKQRHAFQSLITDAQEGEFKAVVCWDQSRFSRFDPMEANYYWHILRREGVFIETVKEGRLDFETLGGWLSASVQQHGKAEYCRSLAADTARGRRKRILEGKWSTPAPYGYRIDGDKLVLGDADKIETVRRVFRMRAKGAGCRGICKVLNSEGIKSPFGKSWSPRQILTMLSRETYIGHMVSGREARGKFCRLFDDVRRFENTHPAIIDAELWAAVQKTGQRRHSTIPGKRPSEGGHLSGLLVCGRCGQPMYARGGKAYVCSSYQMSGQCSYNTLPYGQALAAVAAKIRSLVLLDSVDRLTAQIERVLAKRKASKNHIDTQTVKRQIAEIDRKLEGAAERLLEVEASLVANVRAAMLTLQEKRQGLLSRLEASATEKRKPLSAKVIAANLWELDRTLREGDPATVRAALAQIVDRVVIDYQAKPMVVNPGRDRYIPAGGTIFFCSDSDTSSTLPTGNMPSYGSSPGPNEARFLLSDRIGSPAIRLTPQPGKPT